MYSYNMDIDDDSMDDIFIDSYIDILLDINSVNIDINMTIYSTRNIGIFNLCVIDHLDSIYYNYCIVVV